MGGGLLQQLKLRVYRPTAQCRRQEGPAGHGDPTHSAETDLALFLLYVRKALFHPVLACIVFSLETLIPRFSQQSVHTFTPGDRQQVPLA